MSSLQRRIATFASMTANLVVQLRDLDLLREQVMKAQQSARISRPRHIKRKSNAGHFVPRQPNSDERQLARTKRDKTSGELMAVKKNVKKLKDVRCEKTTCYNPATIV
jgi:hypothetical protein